MQPPSSDPKDFLDISRRTVLRALGGVSLLGLVGPLPGCVLLDTEEWSIGEPGLGALARLKDCKYGAAVQSGQLKDEAFAAVLRREASLLVPEFELKWDVVHPAPHTYNFSAYEKLAAFARANDMEMRGHTLLWHASNPAWLAPALANRGKAEKILEAHIDRVIGETSPFIRNWDVVNEAVFPHSKREDGLRETIWLKALGPGYVALAFRMAHKADPGLTLVYNDYGTEREGSDGRTKRQCILRLLEQCVRDNVPIHALGLQSHLQAHRPLADGEFTAFLKEVRSVGLKILITELDLDVTRLRGRMDDRIELAQNYVRAYLNLVQKTGPVDTLLTWGLTDRYTWLRKSEPDITGALPLDRELNHGPLWTTLRENWLGPA